MFDLKRTLELAKGAVFDSQETWTKYHAENKSWQETAMLITVPMIVGTMILSGILAVIFSPFSMFDRYGGIGHWLLTLIMAFAMFGVAMALFTVFAGVFKGKQDFNRGMAAMSLAMVPAWFGNVLGALPWLGWLLSIAATILSLVYLWRIIPQYLEVPDDNRALHYIVSLICTFIVAMMLVISMGLNQMASSTMSISSHDSDAGSDSFRAPGFLGEMARQGEMMEQASKDKYTPPSDGRLDEDQVEMYVKVMTKATEMQAEYAQRMEKLAEEMEGKEQASLSDFSKIMSGVTGAAGANNAELEVVKAMGGNWAEHSWVGDQLRTAYYQKDTTDAIAHNYALYQEFADELEPLNLF